MAPSLVVLLSCGVPEVDADRLAVHEDVGAVVVKHGRDVF